MPKPIKPTRTRTEYKPTSVANTYNGSYTIVDLLPANVPWFSDLNEMFNYVNAFVRGKPQEYTVGGNVKKTANATVHPGVWVVSANGKEYNNRDASVKWKQDAYDPQSTNETLSKPQSFSELISLTAGVSTREVSIYSEDDVSSSAGGGGGKDFIDDPKISYSKPPTDGETADFLAMLPADLIANPLSSLCHEFIQDIGQLGKGTGFVCRGTVEKLDPPQAKTALAWTDEGVKRVEYTSKYKITNLEVHPWIQ